MTTTSNAPVTVTLAPCPFCEETGNGSLNGNLHFVCDDNQTNHRVKCFSCFASGPYAPSVAEAITAWNTRAEQSATPSASNEAVEDFFGREPLDGLVCIPHTLYEQVCAALTAAPATRDAEKEALRETIINTPETADFMAGVPIEAAHQRERWGSSNDAGKGPLDWFWLIGYLAQKAATAQMAGDVEKALHHTISTAAALANWHAAISGADTSMRPGIEPPDALLAKQPGEVG